MLSPDLIRPNPAQPRKQFEDDAIIRLADSIRRYGILQPLTVRRTNDSFEIVAGERRLRAAQLLGMESVPCIIVNVDSRKSAELAIIENIQRENLNIFEQASAIASLIDMYDLTQEEAARQLSTSQSFVANKLRILRLTAPEREKILAYELTERHARALLKVASVEQRIRIIDYIKAHNLNVATTEAYIDRFLAENESAKRPRAPRRMILKDIRIFYNSIDKAVSLIQQAGIQVESERVEEDDTIELKIRIPKYQTTPGHTPVPDCVTENV
ncbi:MAG: ParB/RepB/Spo0J family partition protein [Clostridia bacterium]|nr:ParB/RepB/Spo0J family partition protein [Clostridia bacterium]